MSFYELTFIVRPDVNQSQVEQITTKFSSLIKEQGGSVIKSESWGLRTLAYRVKKHRKGYYVMLGLEGNGAVIKEVERQMLISDDVIRFLTVGAETMTKEPTVQMATGFRGRRPDAGASRGSRPNATPATTKAE